MNQQERSEQEQELGVAHGDPGAIAALVDFESRLRRTLSPEVRTATVQAAHAEASRAVARAMSREQRLFRETVSLGYVCTECGTEQGQLADLTALGVQGGLCNPCRVIQRTGVVVREHLDKADDAEHPPIMERFSDAPKLGD